MVSNLGKALLVLVIMSVFPVQGAGNLYRYTNDDGVVVVDFQIPTEYVGRGYEVLNSQGAVIKVVPRMLSAEELASQSEADRRAEQDLEARKRQQAEDESLLLRYSAVADIESARDRALRDLRIRVSILRSNRRGQRQKVENAQARIARAERAGKAPLQADLDAIAAFKKEIAATERAIAERQHQIDTVSQDFERDIARFRELQGVVEQRRELERSAE